MAVSEGQALTNDVRVERMTAIRGDRPALTSLDDVLARSDTLVLRAALTDSLRGILGRQALAKVKPGLIVVNVVDRVLTLLEQGGGIELGGSNA